MRKKNLILTSVALVLLAFRSEGIGQSIKVGAVVPLTGRYAALGAQVRAGYEIGVEQINVAGGVSVGGKKMRDRKSVV